MSRYSQYGYYDPVGSSQAQPTGYTHPTSHAPSYPSAAASSGYGSNQQHHGSSAYGGQSYGNNAPSNSSTNHAAAALSSLGNQDYNQTSNRTSTGQYDNSQWYGSNNSSNYNAGNFQAPNRSQANSSPLYASAQASTFGRLSVPEQTQNTSTSYGVSSTYQNAPSSAGTNYRYQGSNNQTAQNPPQRYNSPLHAVQAQPQSHQKQPSRGSNHQPSPQMANTARYTQQSRQASASVEPSPTTVDPSQVYDNRAELERKARHDAERRKKIEAEQAAEKAEEDRLAARKRKVEEASQTNENAKKKEQQDRKSEPRRKDREEKRQSKSAATTLQQMASMGTEGSATGATTDEEAEMRAMFQKMREFNSKNPAMLAKLWEEERKQHAESQPPQAETPAPHSPVARTTHGRQSAAQAPPKSMAAPSKVPVQKPTQPARPAQQAKGASGTQTSPQPAPPRPATASSNTSLWPPHKKGALADATAKWLMGLPDNAGKTISQQAVLNILNANPSYVQLCESLENLDMKFERSTLARELLKAVPDGLRTQQKPSTPLANASVVGMPVGAASSNVPQASRQMPQSSSATGNRSSTSGTVSYSTPLSLSDVGREVNDMRKSALPYGGAVQSPQQSPYLRQSQSLANGSRPTSQGRAASQSQPPDIKPEIPPQQPLRAPADKEEAARKRTFGDLVDLTKDDDSDDEAPVPKRTFQLPSSGPAPTVNAAGTQHRDPLAYLQRQQPFKPFGYRPNGQIPGAGIMQPPQRPEQVGPSPSTQGPQVQAQPASLRPKGPSAEQLQQSRMRGKMLVEPIMRDRVARKSRYDSSTIARDVLLATGRHPDMRGLNAHLSNMGKLLGHHGGEVDTAGTKCDLGTIRWDIIDPEKEGAERPASEGKDADREASVDRSTMPVAHTSTTVDYEAPFTSSVTPKEKKKRGRKPRSSISAETSFAMTNQPGESPNTPGRAATSVHNTPPAAADPTLIAHANDMAAQGQPIGYAAFRQVGPDGQVIKKKGRPVGWKKSLHSREAQGLPAYPKKDGPSKLGRPPKQVKEKALVEPQWQSFFCEWKDCKAELQNLDTLKKHLIKVHAWEVDGGRGYQCLWKDCDRQPGEGGGFVDLEAWIGHVDKAHLQPIAWKQGDGPRGGSLGESPYFNRSAASSPSYLNDAYGRSVTPIIEPTPPPQATRSERIDPAEATNITQLPLDPGPPSDEPKRIGRPPKDGIPKLERGAGAELRKLEEHKRVVGLTMDRQGCVLASEERRATFLGDEDFEDEILASEDEEKGAWD